ncbi:DUF2017 domain-containing protein [Nocardioides acrostichi]|uniref:DUF2017 domain-containing protein n=1 Tax=Nocardioides acrostichi TaxID=2784339 RepID=A0A930Y4D8_9ACTN|nr:DUF2017 domain-containing protein [Nocardioides acrostichi]MBF4160085.1 DUF2017 domain-containing protein [Nocardioides acrostichi]
MSAFTLHRRSGRAIATFSGFEADLLRSLAGQLVELLRHEAAVPDADRDPLEALLDFSGPTTPPEDPVLQRLLPDAYSDDDEAAGEFRRFTEGSLREGKAAGAACIIDTLEEAGLPAELTDESLVIDVELDQQAGLIWMRSLTDLRLALATRLGIEDDDEDRWLALPDDDPQAQAFDIYQWLGYLQETLVGAMSR